MSEHEFDAFAGLEGGRGLSVPEQIVQAGSRARAARLAAFGDAIYSFIPIESIISYPVPMPGRSGPALAFMFSLYEVDDAARDYKLYPPDLLVTIDVNSLQLLGHERWRDSSERQQSDLVCHRFSAVARALSVAERDVLEQELELLYDQVIPAFSRGMPSQTERQAVTRFDLLFRFLVPMAYFPYYEKLNPAFFSWLNSLLGIRMRDQVQTPPRASPGLTPRPRLLLEEYDTRVLTRALPIHDTWRLNADTLASGLRHLSLVTQAGSPLTCLPATAGVSEVQLSTLVENWPTPEWRAALKTLCDPAFKLVQVQGGEDLYVTAHCYIGKDANEIIWVRHAIEEDIHVLSFPISPLEFEFEAAAVLGTPTITQAEPGSHVFSIPALTALAILADSKFIRGEKHFTPTLDGIRRAWLSSCRDGTLRWSYLVGLLSPVPLEPIENLLRLGIAELLVRGLLRGTPARPVVTPELDGFLKELGSPNSYYAIVIHAQEKSGDFTTGGFSGIRTEQRLWISELAKEWDAGKAPSEAKIQLFQVTGNQFISKLSAFLGDRPKSDHTQKPRGVPRFCTHCGVLLKANVRFCTKCGHQTAH